MNNELIEACKAGDIKKVYELIEIGADIHAHNDYALCSASENRHLEVVKFLIDKGADIHAQNDYALRWASENGHLEVVKFLIEKGADIHAQNDYALCWAPYFGHLEVVKFLIEKGADIHAENEHALRLASENEHLEVVKFLIEKGANVSILSPQTKLKLGIPINWSVKPDDLPPFKELLECPISRIVFTADVSKLGCSTCRNVFEQSSLEEWFKTGKESCPMCRSEKVFYAV